MEFGVKFKAIFFASVFLLTLAYLFGRDWLHARELAENRPRVEQVIRDKLVFPAHEHSFDGVVFAYRASDGKISASGSVAKNEERDHVELMLADTGLPYANDITVNGAPRGGNAGSVAAPTPAPVNSASGVK